MAPGGITEELPARRWRRARAVPLVVVVVIGTLSTVLLWRRADADVHRRDEAALARAVDRVDELVTAVHAGLAGADGTLHPDGAVDGPAFHAYANSVVSATTLGSLAFAPVVPESARAEYEQRVGRPVIERPTTGAAPAPVRPLHYPVTEVAPLTEANQQVLGFDLAGDPIRGAAADRARDSGRVVFSEPVPSQPSGRLSFFLVRALYRPGAPVDTVAQRRTAVVGFVSTGYQAAVLREELARGLPEGSWFEVRDGQALLASGGSHRGHGVERTTDATGRTWTVAAASAGGPSRSLAAVTAGVTALLAAALALVWHRTNRYEDQVRRSTTHLQALAGFATGLAPRRSSDDVMSYLTSGVLAPLDGIHAAVGIVEGDRLRRYFTPGALAQPTRTALPATNPLTAETPLTVAARTDEPVLLSSTEEMSERFPDLVEAWLAAGFGATANLPLHDRQGAVIGALGVAWDHPVTFDADLIGRLTTVAGIAGQSLERARLADAEHRLVDALQADVLAPLPPADSLACAARYLPAARSVGMGGDWFEGIRCDDGRYVVVVGDIAGHGITAVGQMAQFRTMIGTLIRLGTPLDELIEHASRSVEGTGKIATAVVVDIDPGAGTLTYVAAGHPPPILRLPDGTTRILDDGRRPLIGVTRASDPAGTHDFPVGATLLCYTDGLIERRTESIDLSVRRLADQVARLAPGDPERMADALLQACLPTGEQNDDVALALITRRA